MSTSNLAADVTVSLFGVLLCLTPAMTRPTLPFGVRVPPERASATVIGQQRRAYYWRTAVIGGCAIVATVLISSHTSWWPPRLILLAEIAADFVCYRLARKQITAVKTAEDWYAGRRQVVATDTSWRSDPPRFPLPWLLPALAVIAATVIIGVIRYPGLPPRLAAGLGGHPVAKSPLSAFAIVIAQLYVTILWTGVMFIVYRSRPDIESADAAASTRRYRRFLAAFSRAVFVLLALIDLSLLLGALRKWQVYRLAGAGAVLPILPFAAGLLILAAVAWHSGQGGYRLAGEPASGMTPAGVDRDDDRFWKAGLVYVNRDDPAIMVGARFGVGWTFNLANPLAWLVLAGIIAVPAGLAVIGAVIGI
jgi:uncharacterized membrane protein